MLTKRDLTILWAVAICVAAVLRLGPIFSGLPYSDYIDEGFVLHQTTHVLNERTWETRWYGYPSLPAYLTAAVMLAGEPIYHSIHGRSFRTDLPRDESNTMALAYRYDLIAPPELIVAGRLATAILSIATVILAGTIAARLAGSTAGTITAILASVCPALVLRASNVIVDTFGTFFVVLTLYLCERLRTAENVSWTRIVGAGIAAGLAFSSKYTAGAVFVAVLIIAFTRSSTVGRSIYLSAAATGGLLAGVLLGAPATFLKLQNVVHDLTATANHYKTIHSVPGYFGQAIFSYELGWPLVSLGCAGVFLIVLRKTTRWAALSWSLFAALLLCVLLPEPFQPFRNILPLVPLVCISAGVAISAVLEWTRHGHHRLSGRLFAATLLVATVAAGFCPSLHYTYARLLHRDTRVQTVNWLQQHTTRGHKILAVSELAILPAEWKRVPAQTTVATWINALELIQREKFDYAVTGDLDTRFAENPAVAAEYLAKWKSLSDSLPVARQFGSNPAYVVPYLWHTNDELIRILKVSPTADPAR